MEPTDRAPGIYLKTDALDRRIDDVYGRRYLQYRRAELLGVDRTTYGRYRNGAKVTDAGFIVRALRICPGATVDDLFHEEIGGALQDVAA